MQCVDCGALRHPGECIDAIRGRKIKTTNVHPPIPVRHLDWCAYFDDAEPDDNGSMMIGRGATRREAIDDLLEIYESQDHDEPDRYNAEKPLDQSLAELRAQEEMDTQ